MFSKSREPEVVVITGATAGVGRATVREFAKRGARIALLARGSERLAETRAEVEQLGGKALAIVADVADHHQVRSAAERIESALGPIDIWINNAMVTVMAQVWETEPDEFERVTEVTYLGSVYGTMAALEHMMPRDRGKILQVGSALAYRGIPLQAAYCGAKHAIQGFTESLRTELMHAKSNIQLSIVHLPAMNTPQFQWSRARVEHHPQPVPPIYEPEIAGDAIYWAAHHDRREMWVGGSTVKTVVGNKVASRAADLQLAKSGYEKQQSQELAFRPSRPNNLWFPVRGHYGARGPFSDKSRKRSPQLWLNKHRKALALIGSSLAVVGGWFVARRG